MEPGAAPSPLGKASIRRPTPSHAKSDTEVRREWFNISGWLPNRRHTLVQPPHRKCAQSSRITVVG